MSQLIYSLLSGSRRPITFITPELLVCDCVKLMVEHDIGALVVHDGKALVGIVSERDIVRSCLSPGLNPHTATAQDIAYRKVSILTVNDPVEKAMEVITLTKRRHLLVTEHDEIIGILSIGDLLFYALEEKARVIEHLENYIHHA